MRTYKPKWRRYLSVIVFLAASLSIAAYGAIMVQRQLGVTVTVANPNLVLSVANLGFGTITTSNSVTPAIVPTFTIQNTGDVALTLSYTGPQLPWPSWAIIRLTTGAIHPGGATLNGVVLPPNDVITVYAALEITSGAGAPGSYSGSVTIEGNSV